MKPFIRVDVGPDGFGSSTTIHDTSSVYSVLSLSYPKCFGEEISSITLKLNRNTITENDTIVGPGKEIRVWNKTSIPVGNSDADRIFRGYIIEKKLEGNEIIVTAKDLFVKAQWTVGTTSQDYETSTPIKTVLTALCTAAGLTALNNAATPSPENIEKFYSNQQNVFERIQYILNLTGWYGYYDPTTTQTIIFQPKSAGGAQTFTSSNIIGVPQWSNDSTNLINSVTMIGGSNNITNQIATFIGTGAIIYTNFGLPYPNVILENVSVTQGATTWPVDEYRMISGSIPTSTGIVFTKNTPPTSGTVTVTYTYQTASSVETASNSSSQSDYVSRSKPIQKRDVISAADLSYWASNLVSDGFWGKPIQEVTILVNDSVTIPVLGSQAGVTDPITGRAVTYATNNTIVYSIELQWPYPGIKTFISSKPLKNPMQQTSVQDSVEKVQLELKKINPTSLLRKDASTPIGGSQDMGGFQVRNLRLENSAVAPGYLDKGGVYYDTGVSAIKVNNGTWDIPNWGLVGALSGSGTTNYLAKFTGSNSIGNSLLSDDGTTVTSHGSLIPSSSDSFDLGSTSYWSRYLYVQRTYIDDTSTYISNNTGAIELHVATGKSVKIVVG